MALTNIVYDEEIMVTMERWDIWLISNLLYDEIMMSIAAVLAWGEPYAYTF